VNALASSARNLLLSAPEVSRAASLRRAAPLFSQGQVADTAYFIDDGLVKLTRTSSAGGRIIVSICGAGHLVGEEVFSEEASTYRSEAEVLSPSATLFRIPREHLHRLIASHPDLALALISHLNEHKLQLAEKVELLCLHDVEYRILHYLVELSKLVKPLDGGEGYPLPITQLELADLIGATRETTSTTLNQLERRGLLKLSRRLLTVTSPVSLLHAANRKLAEDSDSAGAA
jgi:CRP/FNR family transcriptional regulator, anaerobic regulatory protein